MSFTLAGIPVSRGIAIGRAHFIAQAALEVRHYFIEPTQVKDEIARLRQAIATVHKEFDTLRDTLPKDAPEEMAAFLDVHSMILHDEMLSKAPEALIAQRGYNAEWALATQLEKLVQQFDEIEDPYLRERKTDIEQVAERVFKKLAQVSEELPFNDTPKQISTALIVVAHDISPADMLQFRHEIFAGFITDLGGKNSHTAIMARSLDIPATLGLQHASELIRQDDMLIIDGDAGIVIVDPCDKTLDEYRQRQNAGQQARKQLEHLRHTPTQTRDGVPIDLLANIEMPEDAPHALAAGAVGIGLFRSEFLFMNREAELPDEEEQFLAYRSAVEAMRGLPVTIRTIDIGADKLFNNNDEEITCANPALGLRAIRWSLCEPQIFLTQLRALLRASAYGPVKILLPMIAHLAEIQQTHTLLKRAQEELRTAGHAYDPKIKVGAMIEIPASVIALPLFSKHLDFLSIGTNDLIQYTLAIDRTDSEVAHLYDPLHPAVLQLIASTIQQAKNFGLPVSVCGEMAGDSSMTTLLLGMGLREFSMHPTQMLDVKQEIVQAKQADLHKNLNALLSATTLEDFQQALKVFQRKL